MSLGFGAARGPLRLGAVDWAEAAPLVAGLAADAEVVLTVGTAEELAAMLAAGELDAALLPPVHAWRVEGTRFVPGIGLNVRGDAAAQWSDEVVMEWTLELPRVLLVWACRFRAPYPEIRRRLVMAGRATDLPPSTGNYGYGIGSEESDALRLMLGLAKARGAIAAQQDLFYC